MRSSLARVTSTEPTPEESLARTGHVIALRRKLLPAGWALIDLTAVACPERRAVIVEEARRQEGGVR